MILTVFNVIRKIKDIYGGEFDDSVYVIDYSINQVKLSINSSFNWETMTDELKEAFPQANFDFVVIASDLIINF